VWRKVAEAREPSRRAWRHTGRWVAAVLAVAIPVVAVLVIALSLGRVGVQASRPTAPGAHHNGSTINPTAQRVALQGLKGRAGSIVVLNPRTGAIEALATTPARAQTLFAPGATFDVVTAVAALDSGRYTSGSRISGASPLRVSGSDLRNDAGQSLGRITLTDALSTSVNTAFARVGDALGPATMTTYMKRFGFYASPGADQLPTSGARPAGVLSEPTSARVALGPLAAGEGDLTATSLQMAMVAAAVANGGVLVGPHLATGTPAVPERRVMTPRTAQALTQMLRDAVTRGTGTAANLAGLRIAGKTGTARASGPGSRATVASFIAFAPADHPTVAVAVLVRDPHGGFGGTVAAPIAARVIRALLLGRG
jgi:peptidoglycan glycosyltransferase